MQAGASSRVRALCQKAFQDEDCRHLIDDGAMLLAGFAEGVQMEVCLAGRKPLVREVDGQAKRGAEFFGEGLSSERLRADFARHVKWIANDNLRDGMLAEDAANGFQIGMQRAAMKCEERLHGKAKGVRDGQPNALAADVQREQAGQQRGRRRMGLQRVVHSRSVAG